MPTGSLVHNRADYMRWWRYDCEWLHVPISIYGSELPQTNASFRTLWYCIIRQFQFDLLCVSFVTLWCMHVINNKLLYYCVHRYESFGKWNWFISYFSLCWRVVIFVIITSSTCYWLDHLIWVCERELRLRFGFEKNLAYFSF